MYGSIEIYEERKEHHPAKVALSMNGLSPTWIQNDELPVRLERSRQNFILNMTFCILYANHVAKLTNGRRFGFAEFV